MNDELKKFIDKTALGQNVNADFTYWPQKQWPIHVCPTCNRCPSCGRGGYKPWDWQYPYWYNTTYC